MSLPAASQQVRNYLAAAFAAISGALLADGMTAGELHRRLDNIIFLRQAMEEGDEEVTGAAAAMVRAAMPLVPLRDVIGDDPAKERKGS